MSIEERIKEGYTIQEAEAIILMEKIAEELNEICLRDTELTLDEATNYGAIFSEIERNENFRENIRTYAKYIHSILEWIYFSTLERQTEYLDSNPEKIGILMKRGVLYEELKTKYAELIDFMGINCIEDIEEGILL